MVLTVIRWLNLLAFALPVLGSADRLVAIPTATKIHTHTVRAEILGFPSRDTTLGWLGFGVHPLVDAELSFEARNSNRAVGSLNLGYYYLLPITDFAPGIAVGVHDVLNRTEDGRAAYLAVTYRIGNDGELNQDVPTEVTLGVWSRDGGKLFIGASLPFASEFRVFAEHNSIRPAGGFEFRPVPEAVFRMVFEGAGTGYSVSFSRRF